MCARAIRVGEQKLLGGRGLGVITLDCAQLSFFSSRTRTKLQMAEPKAAPSDAFRDLQTVRVASGEVRKETLSPSTVFANTFSTD